MSQNLPGLPSMSSDDDEEPTVVPTPATPGPSSSQTPATPATSKKRALEGTDVTGTQKKRARRSGIAKRNVLLWSLFEETDDKKVVMCKINPACKARIRRTDGSTSGMMSHLTSKHPVDYQIYLKKSTEAIKEKVIVNVSVMERIYKKYYEIYFVKLCAMS